MSGWIARFGVPSTAASEWGMTVSASKTKGMRIGNPQPTEENLQPVVIDGGGSIKMVGSFSYLGSVVSIDCEVKEEVGIHTAKASRAFCCLLQPIFANSKLSTETKRS